MSRSHFKEFVEGFSIDTIKEDNNYNRKYYNEYQQYIKNNPNDKYKGTVIKDFLNKKIEDIKTNQSFIQKSTQSKIFGIPYISKKYNWPLCNNCKNRLMFYIQLNSNQIKLETPFKFEGLLQLFICTCGGIDENHVEHRFISFEDMKDPVDFSWVNIIEKENDYSFWKQTELPETYVEFPKYLSKYVQSYFEDLMKTYKNYDLSNFIDPTITIKDINNEEYDSDEEFDDEDINEPFQRILGYPYYIQEEFLPEAGPNCKMHYFMQFSDNNLPFTSGLFGDGGTLTISYCSECKDFSCYITSS